MAAPAHLLASPLLKKAVRFGISGLVVTLVHAAIAASLIETVLPRPALANGIAFAVATLLSYLINTYWSFSQAPAPANLLRFVVVALLGLCLAMSVAGLAASLGLSYWVGIGCVVLVVPPVTFLTHALWTYR